MDGLPCAIPGVRMKLLSSFLVCVLVCAAAAAAEDHSTHHEGKSGCDAFSWNMGREFSLLLATPFTMQALGVQDAESKYVPLDRRIELKLKPAGEVKLLAPPGRDPGANSFAGLLQAHFPRSSTYRISTDQRLWIDVIGPDGVVKSSKFEMQADCDKLRKSVAFRLEPEVDYWIQLSGSATQTPILLITLDR